MYLLLISILNKSTKNKNKNKINSFSLTLIEIKELMILFKRIILEENNCNLKINNKRKCIINISKININNKLLNNFFKKDNKNSFKKNIEKKNYHLIIFPMIYNKLKKKLKGINNKDIKNN